MYTNCLNCDKALTREQRKRNKFCSSLCANDYKKKKYLENWLISGKLDYSSNTMIKVDSVYRKYIEKEQDNKCAICGIPDIWNGDKLIFVLDHIDGDSSNHNRNNLRLVCPNCDSQLPTYKYHNRNSSRDYRKYKK